jgi:hypothetical protein
MPAVVVGIGLLLLGAGALVSGVGMLVDGAGRAVDWPSALAYLRAGTRRLASMAKVTDRKSLARTVVAPPATNTWAL